MNRFVTVACVLVTLGCSTSTTQKDAATLSVTVIPDSGTGRLAGLTGKMAINIVDGKHFYDFDYILPQ